MFLQIISEHQGHLLSKIIIAAIVVSVFLFLFALFNRNRKTKSNEPKILTYDEHLKPKSKKRWSKSGRKK